MFTIRIISLRKNTDPRVRSLEEDYLKRLSGGWKVRLEDIRQTYAADLPAKEVLLKEADLIEKKIPEGSKFVLLQESGREFRSVEFAGWLKKRMEAARETVFLVGGPFGAHDKILKRAESVLSLSGMTLTHELARLVLLEQLYRASDILRGGGYHK